MQRVLMTAALILLMAWVCGGQALLGRIDPALALPLLFPPLVLLAWLQRGEAVKVRAGTALGTLAAVAAGQALLAFALAGAVVSLQLLVTIAGGAVAAAVADGLVQWRVRARMLAPLAALLLVAGWFAASHAILTFLYRPAVAAVGAPPATMLTGLPLRWSGSGDIAAIIADGAVDDPALTRLQSLGPVVLTDSLIDPVPPVGSALLIAHTRALAPRELVAIDAVVRQGGKAIVLADALSGWPLRHPLGDPRNPPITSLLTPLLDHWGVTLGAAPTGDDTIAAADVEGARLRVSSAGPFERLPPTCRSFAERRIARCPIGAGEAWLVGDADLLFAPLWMPIVPGADHLRQADTIEWLAARLWPGAGVAVLRPQWIRARAD